MQKKLDSKETKRKLSKYEVLDTCFYREVSGVISKYRKHINNTINFDLVLANWEIGRMIDEKQNSLPRAEYGEKLIKELSSQMTKDFGKGYTESNLRYMRMFYKTFNIRHALRDQLSWTHYRLLLSVKNNEARNFYFEQATTNNWSTRQLEREIHNISYERYILGNKDYSIIQETSDIAKEEEKENSDEVRLFIKEPLLLDFLGIKPGYKYYESDLEQAIIDHLEEFLLELGQGFTFVARQKRLDIDGDNFYIDLVLYNIFERCYVLIDLKRGKATHTDIGQMQMYVNYYTENCMLEDDKPPIGMILCADKNDKVIRYTLGPTNKSIKAYKYITYLTEGDDIQEEAEKYLKLIKDNS